MADISAELVKELRERTGAGFMDCKKALDGDRRRPREGDRRCCASAASRQAAKKAGRDAREGLDRQLHPHRRPVRRAHRGQLRDGLRRPHRASSSSSSRTWRSRSSPSRPDYLDVEAIPADVLAAKKAELLADESVQKKPENIREQIVDGQLRKWYQQVVLYEQPFRDDGRRRSASSSRAPSRRSARTSGSGASSASRSGRSCDRRRDRRPATGDGAAALSPHPAQAVRRGAARRSAVRRRPGVLRVHRAAGRGRPRPRRPDRHRRRWRQHLPRPRGRGARHGPRDRRLHRHARDGHERPGPAGRARAGRRPDAGHDRHRDERDRRAVHPPPRDPPPREGPRHDVRRGHRQPLLHDRHGRRAAGGRDQRRGPAQGDQGRRGLRRGPGHEPRRAALRRARATPTCSGTSSRCSTRPP